MCSLLAIARLILPDGFTLKRFAAARFVLIFGILKSPYLKSSQLAVTGSEGCITGKPRVQELSGKFLTEQEQGPLPHLTEDSQLWLLSPILSAKLKIPHFFEELIQRQLAYRPQRPVVLRGQVEP